MDSSPSKRRKTSPTTSVPVDAPTTPSRIPVRKDGAQPLSRRPSFASPTKASLSRHNPQLLRRPSSAGTGSGRQSGGGNDLQDLFAKALVDVRPSIERGGSQGIGELGSTTQGSNNLSQEPTTQSTPRRARSVGGGLSVKPRRMSRSPFKQAPKILDSNGQTTEAVEEIQENINPFRKAGLRRSPVGAQIGGTLQDLETNTNPFEKRGLRRSPRSSQSVDGARKSPKRTEALPEPSTTTADLAPSKTARSPVLVNPIEAHELNTTISQPRTVEAEDTQLSTSEQYEQPPLAPDSTEQPRASMAVEALTFRSLEPQNQQDGPVNHVRQRRSSQAAEPVTLNMRAEPEEPDLPPTPTQLGLADPIVTTPPTGIHDTPSKRARTKAQRLKSSPLKPKDPPETQPSRRAEVKPRPQAQNDEIVKRRRSNRFLVPEDPHASKKKARDDLLRELQQLQADVTLANKENERLSLHYNSRRSVPATPSNPDELLDMLLRSTAPEIISELKTKQASVFKSIDSFLPFSSRRKCQAIPLPSLDGAIPSYQPVALNDSLPYLQAFSPLAYTSHITLLPLETTSSESSSLAADQHILQRHQIKASHPSGLFSARFSMIVDSSLLSIRSLDIEKVSPSAEKELGTFMRERSNTETALNRDIGVVCWAMGRWVEVSALRAKFWCTIENEFGTPEARANSLQRIMHRRKRKRQLVVDDEDTATGLDGNDEDEEMRKEKWTTRQLLPHMGRTALELGNDHVELRFEWRIGFDWTGEVDSSISASARLPKSWQKQDDRKSLERIPASFNKLVKERGPLSAVRTIVGLLMPSS